MVNVRFYQFLKEDMSKKLGFIGCGGISDAHLRGIVELRKENRPTFEVTAVCDIDFNRAEAFATKVKELTNTKPAVYIDYKEMLAAALSRHSRTYFLRFAGVAYC